MIYIASDHAGWRTKEVIKNCLAKKGKVFIDLSSPYFNPQDDYPLIAKKVARQVAKNKNSWGVLICDTGIGMSIAANRVKGIRAALVFNDWMVLRARKHEDANIIVFGEELQKPEKAVKMLEKFLRIKFSGANRHRRLSKPGLL